MLNLDPLSEVTQLNNYSYREAKRRKKKLLWIVSSEQFVLKATKLPRKSSQRLWERGKLLTRRQESESALTTTITATSATATKKMRVFR